MSTVLIIFLFPVHLAYNQDASFGCKSCDTFPMQFVKPPMLFLFQLTFNALKINVSTISILLFVLNYTRTNNSSIRYIIMIMIIIYLYVFIYNYIKMSSFYLHWINIKYNSWLRAAGATHLLIEWEDMFPYEGRLTNISSRVAYSKQVKYFFFFNAYGHLFIYSLLKTGK